MATVAHPHRPQPDPDALRGILDDHARWLASGGEHGRRADLMGANLADADLSGINLCRALLTGADLSRADLTHTVLDHASLARATLAGAELCAATLVGADLTWANLSEADLTDADLTDAILPDAELTGARLVRANLTGAELDGADLTGANVESAIMTGANMSGTRFTGDGMDAAFEADQVYGAPELTPVSELPDADLEELPGPAGATAPAAEAPAATPAAARPLAAPVPGGPADRLAQVAARLERHRQWLDSGGVHGARADLTDLAPLPAIALAGADLSHATLPPGDPLGPAVAHAHALAAGVNRVLGLTLFACLYAALALTPTLMLPGAPVRLPVFGTLVHPILVALALPLLLLLSHLWLHGALQHLARARARLPRRLPDGSAPLAPDWHLPRPRGERLPIWSGMRWLARGLALFAVPGTLALYAGAFSAHATTAGSITLAFLTAAAAGVSMFSLARLRRTG